MVKILILFIPLIEIAQVMSEALKNTSVHRNCLGCKGLRRLLNFGHSQALRVLASCLGALV
jgi:hypothetical protein